MKFQLGKLRVGIRSLRYEKNSGLALEKRIIRVVNFVSLSPMIDPSSFYPAAASRHPTLSVFSAGVPLEEVV